jgi:hypothetical protein
LAGAAEAAGAGRDSASAKLQLAFEALRELETAGADSPLWSGRALDMPSLLGGMRYPYHIILTPHPYNPAQTRAPAVCATSCHLFIYLLLLLL